jgi:hypothetical protein
LQQLQQILYLTSHGEHILEKVMGRKTKNGHGSGARDGTRLSRFALLRRAIASLCTGTLMLPLAFTASPVMAESEEVIEEVAGTSKHPKSFKNSYRAGSKRRTKKRGLSPLFFDLQIVQTNALFPFCAPKLIALRHSPRLCFHRLPSAVVHA